jgi:medium-chain acyl-[acyl-carrier-protein] hydrolase
MKLWITCPKPNPRARLRLFCIPYAGGGASLFHTWSASLPPDIEVCPIQLPGRENRRLEPLFTQLPPLVQTLAHALIPYLSIPFAFFGHSLGALISFEVARLLRRQCGLEPMHLFISGCRAPQIPNSYPPIHLLPEYRFVQEVRWLDGTPEEILENTELMQLVLPILRADIALYETYVYKMDAPLSCSISAFGGLEDGKVNYADLASWHAQTHGPFTLRMLPGGHSFMLSARELLLRSLSLDLTQLLIRLTEGQRM